MINFQRMMTVLGTATVTVLAACSGNSTSASGDATGDGAAADATSGDVDMDGMNMETTGDVATGETAGDATAGDTAAGDTTAAATYKSIVVWDKSTDPPKDKAGKCTASPGTDLDAVALYGKDGKLKGVIKPGTAVYVESKTSECKADITTAKGKAASVEGPLDGKVVATGSDSGYLSLGGGSVEFQIGACTKGTTVSDCDGAGAVVEIVSGDELDVYEVDTSYKKGGTGPQAGNAADICVCYADEYLIDLRPTLGSDTGSKSLPDGKGTTTHIKVP